MVEALVETPTDPGAQVEWIVSGAGEVKKKCSVHSPRVLPGSAKFSHVPFSDAATLPGGAVGDNGSGFLSNHLMVREVQVVCEVYT